MSERSSKLANLQRRHRLTSRMRARSVKILASKVGYFNIDSSRASLEAASTLSFVPGQLIPCKNLLCIVKSGWVQIRHSQYKYVIKQIVPGGVFGEMPLLGQTMLVTEPVAGAAGSIITTMDTDAVKEWIAVEPIKVLELIGPRLVLSEREYFQTQCQLADSAVADILLRLANSHKKIEGTTQAEIAEQIGMYRETVNAVLNELKSAGLIDIQNKSITILDHDALAELSEL
ncbi:MAG: hypothetical protein DMF61_07240 [Blastocatellia bacterium AA13]|nr:MAG: hypothetical protein DMF61_07240 [Blastocatellia bacterium AA13]